MRRGLIAATLLALIGTATTWWVVFRDRPDEERIATALLELAEHRADVRAGVEPSPLDQDLFTREFLIQEELVDRALKRAVMHDRKRGQALTSPSVRHGDMDLDRDGSCWIATVDETVAFEFASRGGETGESYARRFSLVKEGDTWRVDATSVPEVRDALNVPKYLEPVGPPMFSTAR